MASYLRKAGSTGPLYPYCPILAKRDDMVEAELSARPPVDASEPVELDEPPPGIYPPPEATPVPAGDAKAAKRGRKAKE